MATVIPLRPIDRCRALLLPWGRPSLDAGPRAGLPSAADLATALQGLRTHVLLPPVRWTHVESIARCWHDDLAGAVALLPPDEGPALRLVVHRRRGELAEARQWLHRAGRHPAWDRLVPIAAAEGLSGPLCSGTRFLAEAFLTRCHAPRAEEVAALERLQAAELLGLLADAVGG